MQKEKVFFLQVLADYLNKKTTTVPDRLNWHVLEKIGQDHELSGVIYHQCKKSIVQSDLPVEVKTKWKQEYIYNFLLYSKRLALLNQIDTEFQKENIPYLVFKGTEVARFYPVPAQRTMGDLDLLIHEEDKQRAGETLARMGFEVETGRPFEWVASKEEMEIELHHRLLYNKSVELKPLQDWGDTAWDYVTVQKDSVRRKLDLTYHLVYVLLHLRKHFLREGVGFRQFMDVAVLALQSEIDWRLARLWIKELKLEKFSQVCFAFCKRWFSVEIPTAERELPEDFYHDATEKMFDGGVFGQGDKKENSIFNEVHYAKSSATFSILKRIFLPYHALRGVSYCKFLDGRPYLLPVAWCWRIIYLIGTGSFIPYIKGAYSKTTIRKKEDWLARWGL